MKYQIVVTTIVTISAQIIVFGFLAFTLYKELLDNSSNITHDGYADILTNEVQLGENGQIVLKQKNIDYLNSIPRYWQVTVNDKPLAKSTNLSKWVTPLKKINYGQRPLLFTDGGEEIEAIQYTRFFDNGSSATFIMGIEKNLSQSRINAIRSKYTRMLVIVIIADVILLTLMIRSQVGISLLPLSKLQESLKKVASGENEVLEGSFPKEVGQLINEMNSLLIYTNAMLSRYKNFSSNLSHSMKTPLTIMYLETKKKENMDWELLEEKSKSMLDIVDSSLKRFNISGKVGIIGAQTDCKTVIERVCKGVGKLNNIEIKVTCPDELYFHGDEGDLADLLYNLVGNAAKYTKSEVRVSVLAEDKSVLINIEDDGNGIPEEERELIAEHGKRLDETSYGSGIGLSICKDIVELYNGSMTFDDSKLGGAKVVLSLPKAEQII